MYKIFYNSKDPNDVGFVVFKDEEFPNVVKKSNDVVCLYKDGELVGINIFNFSKIFAGEHVGCFGCIDKNLLDKINGVLKNCGVEPLPEYDNSGYKVMKVIKVVEHPLDEKLSLVNLTTNGTDIFQTITRYKNIKEGDLVVAVLDGTLKIDGNMYHKYVSKNIESNVELTSEKDLGLGEEFKLAYIVNEKTLGSDFFL